MSLGGMDSWHIEAAWSIKWMFHDEAAPLCHYVSVHIVWRPHLLNLGQRISSSGKKGPGEGHRRS